MKPSLLIDYYERARNDPSLAVLEGFHPIKHAIRFGASFVSILTTDPEQIRRLADRLAPDVTQKIISEAEVVPLDVFARLTRPRSPIPTGIIALANRPVQSLEKLLNSKDPQPIILLENPRDLGNMGAAIRVAAASGAAGLITIGEHDPWHPAAIRGSAGLHFALPVIRTDVLPNSDRPLIILDPETGESLTLGTIPPRAILAFGGERYGLGEDLISRASKRVRIPMRKGVTSLNLATSVAITLYTWKLSAVSKG